MTAPAFKLLAVKNNVTTKQLVGSIGAADTTLALKSGHGASYPTIYRGDCSSTGSGILLNDTSGLGSVAVGDFIYNLTDASWAVITSISGAPNSVATTPLEGGGDNTWQSGDIWVVNMFIATLVKYDVDGSVLKRERVQVTNRVTDSLTVVRGYDSDTAQTFDADDYVQILVESTQLENLQKGVRHLVNRLYTAELLQASNYATVRDDTCTWLDTITGTNTLTGTAAPALTAYANGQRVAFIVANNCSGAVTLNVNSVGAKALVTNTGAALASGDLLAGGIVECRFDVSADKWFMTSPKQGTTAAAQDCECLTMSIDQSTNMDGGSYTTGESYTFLANELAAGDVIDVVANLSTNGGGRNTQVLFNGTNLGEMVDVRYGRLVALIHIRTSTTAYGTVSMLASATEAFGGYGVAISSLNLASTIVVEIQGKQTSGAETQHYIDQFSVRKYRAQVTQ